MDFPEKEDDDDEEEDPADDDEDSDGEEAAEEEESDDDEEDDDGHVSQAIHNAKEWMKKRYNPVRGMLRRIMNKRKDKARKFRGMFSRLWKNKERESEESPNP